MKTKMQDIKNYISQLPVEDIYVIAFLQNRLSSLWFPIIRDHCDNDSVSRLYAFFQGIATQSTKIIEQYLHSVAKEILRETTEAEEVRAEENALRSTHNLEPKYFSPYISSDFAKDKDELIVALQKVSDCAQEYSDDVNSSGVESDAWESYEEELFSLVLEAVKARREIIPFVLTND